MTKLFIPFMQSYFREKPSSTPEYRAQVVLVRAVRLLNRGSKLKGLNKQPLIPFKLIWADVPMNAYN